MRVKVGRPDWRRSDAGTSGSGTETFVCLACVFGDELEVLIEMENCQAGELGRCCDEKVGDRRGTMLTFARKHQLDFERSVFDRGRQVLDGHGRDRRSAERRPSLG